MALGKSLLYYYLTILLFGNNFSRKIIWVYICVHFDCTSVHEVRFFLAPIYLVEKNGPLTKFPGILIFTGGNHNCITIMKEDRRPKCTQCTPLTD